MTESFFNNHSKDYFEGKTAILQEDYKNIAGDVIEEASKVVILRKDTSRRAFDIRSHLGVEMHGVSYRDLHVVSLK
jgi:hypothetical protein